MPSTYFFHDTAGILGTHYSATTHNFLILGTSNANFKKRAPAQKNTKLDLGAVQKQQRKSQLPEKSTKLKDVPTPKVPAASTATITAKVPTAASAAPLPAAANTSEATKKQASTPPSSSSDAESPSSSSASQQSATQATSFTGLIRQASLKNFFTRSNAGIGGENRSLGLPDKIGICYTVGQKI